MDLREALQEITGASSDQIQSTLRKAAPPIADFLGIEPADVIELFAESSASATHAAATMERGDANLETLAEVITTHLTEVEAERALVVSAEALEELLVGNYEFVEDAARYENPDWEY